MTSEQFKHRFMVKLSDGTVEVFQEGDAKDMRTYVAAFEQWKPQEGLAERSATGYVTTLNKLIESLSCRIAGGRLILFCMELWKSSCYKLRGMESSVSCGRAIE